MTLNNPTSVVEKNTRACDSSNSRDMLATNGSQNRKYGRNVESLGWRSSSTVQCDLSAIAVGHCDDALAGRNRRGMVLREVQANAVVMRTELGTGRDNDARLMAQ
jgi:hypothetical protein